MEFLPSNYKSLFKLRGRLTCLHSEFLINGSLGMGNVLVVCKENDFRSFISIEGEKKCLQKGLEVFSSPSLYKEYSDSFREYIATARREIIPRFEDKQQDVTLEEFRKLKPILGKFWYFYGMTEFSFHELAHERMLETNDPSLKSSLDDLGRLKFEGRELLNSYIFEEGVLHSLLLNVGKRFLKDSSDGLFLFGSEIEQLLEGSEVPEEILARRKTVYGCAMTDGIESVFTYEESQGIWQSFCVAQPEEETIKGTIANKGIVRGRVVIAPMLVDMKEISLIDSRMQKGDILVAESTTPELMMLCKKASAIVTDQGGMLSHAAIVSRELGIPCVIGTGKATHILKDGDIVEVDANRGIVNRL